MPLTGSVPRAPAASARGRRTGPGRLPPLGRRGVTPSEMPGASPVVTLGWGDGDTQGEVLRAYWDYEIEPPHPRGGGLVALGRGRLR